MSDYNEAVQRAAVAVVARFRDSDPPHTWALDDLEVFADLVDDLHLALIDLEYSQVIRHE